MSSLLAATDAHFELSPAEFESVFRQGLIIKEIPNPARGGRTFDAYGLIEAPMARVYSLLIDYARLPNFMPNLQSIDVLSRDDSKSIVNNTLDLPLGKKKKYRLSSHYRQDSRQALIEWKLIAWPDLAEAETIRDTQGYWLLEPSPRNPQHTLVRYHVYTDPGDIPFGMGWIVDYLVGKSIPNIFTSTRSYIRNNESK